MDICARMHACVTGRWGVVEGHQSEQAVLFFIATDNKPQSINAIQEEGQINIHHHHQTHCDRHMGTSAVPHLACIKKSKPLTVSLSWRPAGGSWAHSAPLGFCSADRTCSESCTLPPCEHKRPEFSDWFLTRAVYCCDSNGEFTQRFWKLKALYSLKESMQCTNTHVQKSMVFRHKLIHIFIQSMVKYTHIHYYALSHTCLHACVCVYIYICACVYTYIHVCVCVREKERDVCVCVWEAECLPLFIAMCLGVHKWTYLWDFFLSLSRKWQSCSL